MANQITNPEAQTIHDAIVRALDPYVQISRETPIAETTDGTVISEFRSFKWGEGLYRERRGEQDDDQPDFVGYDKAKVAIHEALIGTGWTFHIYDSEKCWFDVHYRKAD